MNNTTNLSSLIWSSADDVLRGLFKSSEYGRVILPFVVMRRLDCVLEPKKDEVYKLYTKYKDQLSDPSPVILQKVGLPFFNTSKFDLSRIKGDSTNVLINFDNYVQGYSKNVLDIIENFSIHPLVEKLHNHDRLYRLIDKFTEFDLHPDKIDNHQMGSIYEELLRKFSEMSNEESGDHFTPRDVVKLLVSFVFGGDKEDLQGEGMIRSVFDPCCGTGGMLTIGKEWVLENINPNLRIDLYGQELNDVTYSICKSDLLMMDENPENIQGPASSISDDRHQGHRFDYMITNPPFGVSWKSEKEFVDEEAKDPAGRFFVGTPRTSDGSLLFLQHLIHKMNPEGSRIGIIFNGSPLFTGDAGSGESEIRRWIIENDWLECIVSLPDRMFFNTGITTYIWIVTNKKSPDRAGRVQLIDGASFFTSMKRNLGHKGKHITKEQTQELFRIYQNNEENDFCKIFPNNFFGYTKVMVEQPLIEDGNPKTDRQGNPKPDISKRDNERVPLSESVDEYYEREVKPYLPNSWMNRSKDKVGYKIGLTKYFYKFTPLRGLDKISRDLESLDDEIKWLSKKIELLKEQRTSMINQCATKGLNPNVEMKDSGVEWIGEIPEHWSCQKLKFFARQISDKRLPVDGDIKVSPENVESQTGKILNFYSDYETKGQIFKPGDILFNKLRVYLNKVVLCDFDGLSMGEMIVIRPHSILGAYLYRVLNSSGFIEHVNSLSEGVKLPRPPIAEIFDSLIPIPPESEQYEVTDYLGRHLEKTDLLVEKHTGWVDLISEYRQSLISSVVTGKIRVTEDMG